MDHEHDLAQKQFANVAANYATSSVHISGKDLDAMLACVELQGNECILDAGCGQDIRRQDLRRMSRRLLPMI